MPPLKDITGEEHGNLVVLGLADHKYIVPATGQAKLLWRVQCKLCGTVKEMTATAFWHDTSCGCARPVKQYRTCPICGKQFAASPSDKTVCCSLACGREYKRRRGTMTGGGKWSLSSKQKRRTDPQVKAQMVKIGPAGTKAALSIPEGQRGPQNRGALLWILIDPQGNYHKAVNLLDWARKNKNLFFDPDVPEDVAAVRISNGFRAIAASMRGAQSRKGKPVTSYYGWRVAELPRKPSEADKSHDNVITTKP